MNLKKKVEALDDFFGVLLWFVSMIVPFFLAVSYVTSNLVIFVIPFSAFIFWVVVIVWGYRARVKFRNEYEMHFLETARAYAYFICLAFTMTANSIQVFYQGSIVTPIVVIGVGIGLNLLLALLVRSMFREEFTIFETEQKTQFIKVLAFVASATIYYSIGIAVFDLLVFDFLKANLVPNIFEISILSAVYLIPIYATYNRENKSRRLQESLAISLRKTRLKNKHEAKQNQKRRRLLRHQRA